MEEFDKNFPTMQPANEVMEVQDDDDDEFYGLVRQTRRPTTAASIVNEALLYLENEDRRLSLLQQFPTIKKMFIKFNTPLPSSATIERIFNYGGMIDDNKRARIVPKNLENNIILKSNRIFKTI